MMSLFLAAGYDIRTPEAYAETVAHFDTTVGVSQIETFHFNDALTEFGSNIEIIAPAAFISLAIPLAVFFAFQRYFVQGLLAGSVK